MNDRDDQPVVVARTTDTVASAIWVDALRQEGIAARSVERGVGPALGGLQGIGQIVILVRQSEIADARSIIADLDGASALAPVQLPGEQRAAASRALAVVGWGMAMAVALGLAVRFLF